MSLGGQLILCNACGSPRGFLDRPCMTCEARKKKGRSPLASANLVGGSRRLFEDTLDAIVRIVLSDLVDRGLRVQVLQYPGTDDVQLHLSGPRRNRLVTVTHMELAAGARNPERIADMVIDRIREAAPSVLIPYRQGKWRKFGARARVPSGTRRRWRGST